MVGTRDAHTRSNSVIRMVPPCLLPLPSADSANVSQEDDGEERREKETTKGEEENRVRRMKPGQTNVITTIHQLGWWSLLPCVLLLHCIHCLLSSILPVIPFFSVLTAPPLPPTKET